MINSSARVLLYPVICLALRQQEDQGFISSASIGLMLNITSHRIKRLESDRSGVYLLICSIKKNDDTKHIFQFVLATAQLAFISYYIPLTCSSHVQGLAKRTQGFSQPSPWSCDVLFSNNISLLVVLQREMDGDGGEGG